MLATNNTFLEEAAETAYKLSSEEMIRMQCEAREDFYRQQRYIQKRLEKLEQLEKVEECNANLQESVANLQQKNANLLKDIAEKEEEIKRLKEALSAQERPQIGKK